MKKTLLIAVAAFAVAGSAYAAISTMSRDSRIDGNFRCSWCHGSGFQGNSNIICRNCNGSGHRAY